MPLQSPTQSPVALYVQPRGSQDDELPFYIRSDTCLIPNTGPQEQTLCSQLPVLLLGQLVLLGFPADAIS